MGIYHPPPRNDITNTMFIDEITELLEDMMGKYNNMVLLGDLNMHIDDLTNTDSYIFNDTMHACDITNPQMWPHPRPSK